ncbi:helix-turn-helix transcriptional regulator [Alteromonas sp.]|jgi:DNA-binding XRE family transcriptional regulator|uniref:helix-turn-helix domain-containing protein n=1 Tax=Alteromonas sp. TaxID=232 RepID=UPI0032D92FA3
MRSEQASKLANKLGDLIRQHRTLNYTQSTFAKMIGVSRSTVQKLEQGEVVKSDILFEALVALQLQGSLLDEVNELVADAGGYNARQRKSRKTQEINDDF